MAEKKATAKKATETKAAAAKKTTVKKAAAKTVLAVNAENAGFKAGDVYQALAAGRRLLRLLRFQRRRLCSVSAGSSRRVSSLTTERKLHWHKTI